jgi:uncharacterized damage-inducible protein DinB
MYKNIQEFVEGYGWESGVTSTVLDNLTPASLSQKKAEGHNTMGELAFHIATAPAMMMREVKWDLPDRGWAPSGEINLDELKKNYRADVEAIKKLANSLSEEKLNETYTVFGMPEMVWNSHQMIGALVCHEIHHRGQLSVMMRQAGLVVPSIYGPNYEATVEMMKNMQQG